MRYIATSFITAGTCLWLLIATPLIFDTVLAQTELAAYQPESTDSYEVLTSTLLWNGEESLAGEYLTAVASSHDGAWCGMGQTDKFNRTLTTINVPVDISDYDEVWFWLRVEHESAPPLQPVRITGSGWDIPLGKAVKTQTANALVGHDWTLVRLKIADIAAANVALKAVKWWRFESVITVSDAVVGYPKIYVDDVYAVRGKEIVVPSTPDPVDPGDTDPEPVPPPTYGTPQPVSFSGGVLRFESRGSDGSTRVETLPVTIRFELGAPVVTYELAPEVTP